ncbi:ImcF-related family protein [Pseudomonas sp. NPDC089395]|uniref:ImcF-related family protein n=1 Tax=Pseudomonas sp. NPDC089395 TaxID=3364460 RepID=UPI003817CCAB
MKKQISIWIVLLCIVVIGGILIWVDNPIVSVTDENNQLKLFAGVLGLCLLVLLLDGLGALGIRKLASLEFSSRVPRSLLRLFPSPARSETTANTVRQSLRDHYGFFWRRKVRLLLVVGESEQIEAIAPGLAEQQWLEAPNAVLLYGGGMEVEPNIELLAKWRGLDGVVWVLSKEQSRDVTAMSSGARRLQNLAKDMRWQLPLHLWQVCETAWPQSAREVQPVGCSLPARFTATQLDALLQRLQQPLREQGLAQLQNDLGHDFLLRLSRDFGTEGGARWRAAMSAVQGGRGVSLRGLWFSLPLAPRDTSSVAHHWLPAPAWLGVLGHSSANPQRLGWSASRIGYVAALSFAAVWGAGLLLSFVSNRAEVGRVEAALATLQQPVEGHDSRVALTEVVRELSRLDYRTEHGGPWYQRFGLNRSEALRDALWPHYVGANNRLVRDPAASALQAQLNALVKLPPNSPERSKRTREAYNQLKAYLMLARPEKADATFLVQTLGNTEPTLWTFFAEQLPANPDWAIKADAKLIAQARQVLLGQLGQRNAESSLYQRALESAANHYPAQGLQQLVGDTDASALFSTQASVPGVFTRQAWEGHMRDAIEEAAKARREEIDWVLSDNPDNLTAALSPDQLRERLTARYFQDYSSAWLAFLNSLRWQQGDSLEEVIAQLTLMSDVRQSPLIALMNTLAYQGQAGIRGQALADSLLKSARNLIGQDKPAVIEQLPQGLNGPLDSTFGPLLALLGKSSEGQRFDDNLSLQAFLTRVTSVRLKLQQVTQAPDPQAMTQALAQAVFQGKRIDLTETQSYGQLIAASLGAEWGGAAQALFVQPLDQAWQRVLQPSAAGLNRNWERAIVNDWNGAFAGRYPFVATSSDASLPMLGQMIRADSGRIEQFVREQLAGLLRKEGSRWVADPRHSQGLRINPRFLAAINQLSALADVLYTDGGMGMSFELRGKPVRDVVQTTFILNGEKHHYFNQRERWQQFRWPGQNDYPGVSLTWTSVHTGERLFADLQGTWGLIRLLEQAQVTHLNDGGSQMRVVLKAPDGIGLTWHLRTELGGGPLALLGLRGFQLPRQIFLVEDAAEPRFALREELE